MTLTVHKHDRISKMAEVVDNLFVFGVDFEAILDILEDDEALEDQFTTIVSSTNSGPMDSSHGNPSPSDPMESVCQHFPPQPQHHFETLMYIY